MAALCAEGLFCSTAHNEPLYQNPEFQWASAQADVHCPEAERIFASEVVSLGKGVLQSRKLVDQVLEALQKMRDNIDELAREPVAGTKPAPTVGRKNKLKSLIKRVIR